MKLEQASASIIPALQNICHNYMMNRLKKKYYVFLLSLFYSPQLLCYTNFSVENKIAKNDDEYHLLCLMNLLLQ